MRFSIGNEQFELSDALLSAVVRAIDKAISEDVPNQIHTMPLETSNYIRMMRGDFINQNLRDFAVLNGGTIHPFKRFSWEGRLLVDHGSHLTISVTSQSNLMMIPRKLRQRPHFMQSILHGFNGDLHGKNEQICIYDPDPFDDETYAMDLDEIVNGAFDPSDGYRHCVVVYSASSDELVDVKLVVLDPWFNTVTEESLLGYMKPDFAKLSEPTFTDSGSIKEHDEATRRLSTLKTGIKPFLKKKDKEG